MQRGHHRRKAQAPRIHEGLRIPGRKRRSGEPAQPVLLNQGDQKTSSYLEGLLLGLLVFFTFEFACSIEQRNAYSTRRNNGGDSVLVYHLTDGVFQQHNKLIK